MRPYRVSGPRIVSLSAVLQPRNAPDGAYRRVTIDGSRTSRSSRGSPPPATAAISTSQPQAARLRATRRLREYGAAVFATRRTARGRVGASAGHPLDGATADGPAGSEDPGPLTTAVP